MLALADAMQADYERRKRAEAALDYDDLIVKTQNLLSRADAAAWVLYKIDGGIDHILVDEAQDTNPAQWSIIEALGGGVLRRRGRKREAAHAVRRRRREAVDLLASRARTRRGSARWAAPSGNGPRRSVSPGTRCRSPSRSARPSRSSKRSTACSARRLPRDGLTWQDGRDHPAPRASATAKRGWSSCGRSRPRRSPSRADAFEPWNEEPAGARSVDAALQAHRRRDQRLAR